ncbi:MAG: hypothetical protein ACRCV9_17990 [Burkholderiaceae bacterium]
MLGGIGVVALAGTFSGGGRSGSNLTVCAQPSKLAASSSKNTGQAVFFSFVTVYCSLNSGLSLVSHPGLLIQIIGYSLLTLLLKLKPLTAL